MDERELRLLVAELVEEDPDSLDEDHNLFTLGLESIALMKVVSSWRRSGVDVTFVELAERPTLRAWTELLTGGRPAAPAAPATRAEVPAEGLPLATLQHAYWIGRGEAQRFGSVAAHLYVEFDGADVDADRLAGALRTVVARHAMLRARVGEEGTLRFDGDASPRVRVEDLRSLDPAEVDARLDRLRDQWSHQVLDVEQGEMFALGLTRLPGGRDRLHVDVDMITADAVSYRILLADLAAAYAGETLPALDFDYPDYRLTRPTGDAAARDQRWWRERLDELPGAPDLPTSPANGPVRVTRRHVRLDAAGRRRLDEVCRTRGVTPAAVMATAFAEVVGAWSARPRFLVNVPLFDREPVHPRVPELVGDFTSSVLLAVDLTGERTFVERVRDVQHRLHTDTSHAAYSGVEVLRDLTRRTGEQVIAPVVFTSALNLGELFAEAVRATFGDPVWIVSQGPQVLLDAQVTELDGGLLVNWDVREPGLAAGVVDAMFDAFRALVADLLAGQRWDEPVGDLLPAAQRAVRARVNDTASPESGNTLHGPFFALAGRAPHEPALLWRGGTLSYGELAERALRVAAGLVARGVRPGDAVGIRLERGPDQVAAVLGVLAAGAVYVPLGLDQPPARARRRAELAGVAELLSGELVAGDRPLPGPVPVDAARAAYLLFTSGSTGEPKGVAVPHRAAVNTVEDLVDRFAVTSADRTLAVSSLDFDLSVFDLFAPLSVGGAVVLVDQDDQRAPAHWAELMREHRVSVLNCVPALLDMLLVTGGFGDALRVVLLGGDRVGTDLPARLARVAPDCRFAGLGGTTETAIHSTVCEVRVVDPAWTCVPYGTPLRNVRCRVVDQRGRDCPDRVTGELWIGGAGVADGYRDDPARTARRFVVHEGVRWYRTGDLARYLPDGTIEFLGRRDDQLKLRGFRVEPGEVVAALLADERVSAAAVVPVGRASLGAAVVTTADPAALTERLAQRLPAHLIPDVLLAVDALPLTHNGKVDRAAVTALVGDHRAPARTAPSTDLERVIARVWREVLEVEEVGTTDPLFTLGGDSVLATRIVARLRDELDSPVTVRDLFAGPTVAALAARLLAGTPDPHRLNRVATLAEEIGALSDEDVAEALAGGR
ncbi:non-ribosomal peptide synthetase [Actinophytocola xinjiangensis]|nr:non-ribosomal peptide synthetase [Actinophytocola xinjiangensis]